MSLNGDMSFSDDGHLVRMMSLNGDMHSMVMMSFSDDVQLLISTNNLIV